MELQKGRMAEDQQSQVFQLQSTPLFKVLDTYIKGIKYSREVPYNSVTGDNTLLDLRIN